MKPYLVPAVFTLAVFGWAYLVAWVTGDWLIGWGVIVGASVAWLWTRTYWQNRCDRSETDRVQALREAYQNGRRDGQQGR